jgi:hypothetical protein
VDELVHAARTQRRSDDVGQRGAGVDVTDQLRLALGGVGAFPQKDDLGLLFFFLVWGGGREKVGERGSKGAKEGKEAEDDRTRRRRRSMDASIVRSLLSLNRGLFSEKAKGPGLPSSRAAS